MKEEKKITQQDIDQAHVTLKPLFGIASRVWLPRLILGVLVATFLALATVPGIIHNGSVVDIRSLPGNAAVHLGQAYLGSTPGKFFIAAGLHSLRISRPGFESEDIELDVGGRIFGSLLFPRRASVTVTLACPNPQSLIQQAYATFSEFGLTGPASAIYQLPSTLSDSLLALAESTGASLPEKSDPATLAASAFAAAGSSQSLRDALRATFLAASGGTPGPLGLAGTLETLGAAFADKPQLAAWMRSLVPAETKTILGTSSALTALASRAESQQGAGVGLPSSSTGRIQVGSHNFIMLPAASFRMAGESPGGPALAYDIQTPVAGLAATETTWAQWDAFVAANPECSVDNREALIRKGLVEASYLTSSDESPRSPSLPVTGISFHAAQAYCDWLSQRAPSGYRVSLPSEALWEAAARAGSPDIQRSVFLAAGRTGPAPVGSSGTDRLGFSDLAGNVWEWCEDGFVPYPALLARNSPWIPAERVVRGGSWGTRAEAFSLSSRGGFQPSAATQFLGFRPALVRR